MSYRIGVVGLAATDRIHHTTLDRRLSWHTTINDERAPLWKARRDEIFDEIERLSNKTRGAGAMRVMAATP